MNNPTQVIDELTYRSYLFNRRLGITPEGFTRLGFPDVEALERRFQLERLQAAERDSRAEPVA